MTELLLQAQCLWNECSTQECLSTVQQLLRSALEVCYPPLAAPTGPPQALPVDGPAAELAQQRLALILYQSDDPSSWCLYPSSHCILSGLGGQHGGMQHTARGGVQVCAMPGGAALSALARSEFGSSSWYAQCVRTGFSVKVSVRFATCCSTLDDE